MPNITPRIVPVREAKAQFSSLVNAAAKGETFIITSNRRRVAVIAPFIEKVEEREVTEEAEEKGRIQEAEEKDRRFDPASFKQALLSIPSDPGF